ncbi:Uma2 family endonuclease [Streptomyces sp. SCA3-4]|uniref:Uma2 family endonuclease n=1 Tax=Streptomyces sichuanensis TaxID=2871810 RepID=UPI001CE3196E|nr:Uma2 family endonuclease [Streptomyces sichuanensis]MCA6092760.1 Uma2 family endonuclease [Streptomyces sichuanensis]
MTVQDDFLRETAERAASVFEGFKIEVVGGRVIMTPQSDIQGWTIRRIQNAVEDSGLAEERFLTDVLISFPEGDPPRCPDVAIIEEGSTRPYTHEDLLAAIEVVSTQSDDNDYRIKVEQYARYGVPAYLIVDPFEGKCTLLTHPRGDTYATSVMYAYGEMITMHLTDGSKVEIPTDKFKRWG